MMQSLAVVRTGLEGAQTKMDVISNNLANINTTGFKKMRPIFHDLLYENQKHLRDEDLHAYAEQLGLDVELFDREMADQAHLERVHEDFMSGVRSGVNGTPTFYVNGVRHDDSWDADTLLEALERAASS